MIFDHIVLIVSDANKSKQFYLNALAPLGINLIRVDEGCVGFGTQNKASLWLCQETPIQEPMHIAFIADSRKAVDEFHKAAMSVGAKDNGAPGIRDHYRQPYYAAFVIDPDGHNIEAVCRKPE